VPIFRRIADEVPNLRHLMFAKPLKMLAGSNWLHASALNRRFAPAGSLLRNPNMNPHLEDNCPRIFSAHFQTVSNRAAGHLGAKTGRINEEQPRLAFRDLRPRTECQEEASILIGPASSRTFVVRVSIQETLIQNLYHISAIWGRFKVWTTTKPLTSYAATLLFGS